MKYKHWKVAPPCPEARAALEEAGVPPLLAAVLSARGVRTWDQAGRLLSPEEEPLPFYIFPAVRPEDNKMLLFS